eukprot:1157652-Pelagomonas_calceolata.AAC.20
MDGHTTRSKQRTAHNTQGTQNTTQQCALHAVIHAHQYKPCVQEHMKDCDTTQLANMHSVFSFLSQSPFDTRSVHDTNITLSKPLSIACTAEIEEASMSNIKPPVLDAPAEERRTSQGTAHL